MRIWLPAVAFLLLRFTTSVWAETPPQTMPTTALVNDPAANTQSSQASPSAATLTAGRGNNCAAKYYPALAIRLNHEGSTIVTVHIDETGKVSGVDLAQSSGFTDLDQASVQCVANGWHFIPATQNGKPVASTRQYRIVWKLTDPNTRPWLKFDNDGLCTSVFASAKIRWPSYRQTTLQFRLSPAGAVEFPFVAISSGDPLFDDKAIECMTKLSYVPAQLGGVPAEVSWTAAVIWSPHTGLTFADGREIGPYCPDTDFPAGMWKGDPSGSTEISFQVIPGVSVGNFAIEKSSGNPELDQAALSCLTSQTRSIQLGPQGVMTFGILVRFNWHQGHVFVLNLLGD